MKKKNLQATLKKVSKKMIKKTALKQLEKELALKMLALKKKTVLPLHLEEDIEVDGVYGVEAGAEAEEETMVTLKLMHLFTDRLPLRKPPRQQVQAQMTVLPVLTLHQRLVPQLLLVADPLS